MLTITLAAFDHIRLQLTAASDAPDCNAWLTVIDPERSIRLGGGLLAHVASWLLEMLEGTRESTGSAYDGYRIHCETPLDHSGLRLRITHGSHRAAVARLSARIIEEWKAQLRPVSGRQIPRQSVAVRLRSSWAGAVLQARYFIGGCLLVGVFLIVAATSSTITDLQSGIRIIIALTLPVPAIVALVLYLRPRVDFRAVAGVEVHGRVATVYFTTVRFPNHVIRGITLGPDRHRPTWLRMRFRHAYLQEYVDQEVVIMRWQLARTAASNLQQLVQWADGEGLLHVSQAATP